jgi:CubicO group peptidase (beta-lactamase class C family)
MSDSIYKFRCLDVSLSSFTPPFHTVLINHLVIMSLTTQSIENIKSTLDSFVKDGAPGLVFHAIDRSGRTLVKHASGTVGVDSDQPMDADSTMFWIASCTKLVTVIAVLQLVEQNKIPLDDAEFVKKITPELAEKKVYPDGVNGVEKEKDITVRMLLSHTAGFAYSFADPRIKKEGLEGSHGDKNDILDAKLVNQPGSMFEYGVSLGDHCDTYWQLNSRIGQHRLGGHHS